MTSPRVRTALEVVGLLAAPVLVFFLLGVQGMTNTNIEDAHFYQAYAEHGDDLMLRLGDYRYYWVRLAFILPARVAYDVFGAVQGFFVWRYLLVLIAIVPAYLLLRRLYGIAAGFVAVAAVLSSPVLIYAWGTDYPDSSAVSYLVAGTACLFMPVRGERQVRGRLGWLTLAGTAYTLAAHSQFISGPLVVVAAFAYLAMVARADRRAALRATAVLLGCAAVVTGVLSLTALIMWDRPDIIYPTIRAALHFRTPNELRKWHSPNWHWFLRTPYLLVPYVVPLLWAVVARLTPKETTERPSPELGLAVVAMLQMLLFTYLQFFAVTSELEYHVYSSMLWSATLLVLAVTVVRACGVAARARPAGSPGSPAALVLVVPYAMTVLRGHVEFELVTGDRRCRSCLLAVVGALVRVAARVPRSCSPGWSSVAMIGTTYLLTVVRAARPALPAPAAALPRAHLCLRAAQRRGLARAARRVRARRALQPDDAAGDQGRPAADDLVRGG